MSSNCIASKEEFYKIKFLANHIKNCPNCTLSYGCKLSIFTDNSEDKIMSKLEILSEDQIEELLKFHKVCKYNN